jgi:type VII secretion protein EccB
LIRRLEHALIRGDARMIHDPMRGQTRALIVGAIIAVLIVGACGVLAFFKPTPNLGDASILMSKSTGASYVRVEDRIHPVLNLASARLIVGKNDQPKDVDDKFLNQLPRGPMVGIVGAPSSIRGGDDMVTSSWTVCDTLATPGITDATGFASLKTTVLASTPVLDGDIRPARADEAVLTEANGTTYLLQGGVRAPIDLSDPVVTNAFHLQDAEVRQVSPGLLNAFTQVGPLAAIAVPDAGQPSAVLPPEHPIGSIIRVLDSRGEQLFVVLRDGVQALSPAAADVIRYGQDGAASARPIPDVAPAMVADVPRVSALDVDHYPPASPRIVPADPNEVLCLGWQRPNDAAQASIQMFVGHRLPMPAGAQPVRLATADGMGARLDEVYLTPGSGEYVQTTGGEPDSHSHGPLFYVSDTGLRYHLEDTPTAQALGVVPVKSADQTSETPQFAPWPVLELLPPGPELSQEAALITHDGVAADPDSRPLGTAGSTG